MNRTAANTLFCQHSDRARYTLQKIALGGLLVYGAQGVAAPAAAQANSLRNGSFESPFVAVDSTWSPGQSFDGWTVDSASINLVGSYFQAAEGRQSVDLNGNPGPGAIYQDVSTIAGRTYRVRFALAGHPVADPLFPGCDQGVKRMSIGWNSTTVVTLSFDTSGHSLDAMGWQYREFDLVATGSRSRLRFASETPGYCGAAVDDVALVLIGMPPTTTSTTTVGPVVCEGQRATIVGTNGDDTISGTPGRDVIAGLGGNDRINGRGGADLICGDDGNDWIVGDDTADAVDSAGDRIFGGSGDDTIAGCGGPDSLYGGPGNDLISGEDIITSGLKYFCIRTGSGQILGSNDQIFGGDGFDQLLGGDGFDSLAGEEGNDFLSGGNDSDLLKGGVGDDTLTGGPGADSCSGDAGVDRGDLTCEWRDVEVTG